MQRLETLLRGQTFWCARPDTLDDQEEFAWQCEYDTTQDTVQLLVEALVQVEGGTEEQARDRVVAAVASGRLELLAKPIIARIIQQCRNEIGLVCFGTSPSNSILWQRYGGNGSGVCVELDVPSDPLGNQLHRVQYSTAKLIHLDKLLRAFLDTGHVREVYSLALLSKPSCWAPQEEIRFISKKQKVPVRFDRAQITRLILGDAFAPDMKCSIASIVESLTYPLQIAANVKSKGSS